MRQEDLDLTLRLINEAMKQTAMTVHGYDAAKLSAQSKTPTHVIYSNLSRFDTFLQMLITIAIQPNLQSYIRVGQETEQDVFSAAMKVICRIFALERDENIVLAPTLT